MSSKESYVIREVVDEDIPAIHQFLQNGFYKEEPLRKYIREKYNIHTEWDEIEQDLHLSLIAVKDGKIIAIIVNRIIHRSDIGLPNPPPTNITELVKYHTFINKVWTESDFWSLFPECKKALQTKKVYVLNEYRHMGIYKEFRKKTW